MSVNYTWIPNRLKPGTYYARVVPQGVVRTDDMVADVAAKTVVQPVDVRAVIDSLDDEIVDALQAGRSVIIDDFLGLRVSLELNNADEATSPTKVLTPEDVTLRVGVSAKPALVSRIRNGLQLEQTTTRIRVPQPQEIYDHLTKLTGQYSAGGVIEVRGMDLDLPSDFEDDPAQGVFFIDALEMVTRAETYIREGNKTITCIVPAGVSGTVAIEVRSNYGGPNLRTGKLENVAQA